MMNGAKFLLTVSAFGLGAYFAPAASAKCPEHAKEQACIQKCKAGMKKTAMKQTSMKKSAKAVSYKKSAVSASACPTTAIRVTKQEFCPSAQTNLRWSESAKTWSASEFSDYHKAADAHYIPVNRVDFWYANPCDRFSRGGNENLTDVANYHKLHAVRSGMAQAKIQAVRENCPTKMTFTKSTQFTRAAACPPKTVVRSQAMVCRPVRAAACPPKVQRTTVISCPQKIRTTTVSCPTQVVRTRTAACPQRFYATRVSSCPPGHSGAFQASGYRFNADGQQVFHTGGFPSSGQSYYIDSKGRMRQW